MDRDNTEGTSGITPRKTELFIIGSAISNPPH